MLVHIVLSDYKWFYKIYLKHESAKPFISVFTPGYPDKNVSNVKFFEPKNLITI